MTVTTVSRDVAPPHPGTFVRDEVMVPLNMSAEGFAKAIGVTRQQVHRVVSGKSGISMEMAMRIGRITGFGPDKWVRRQANFEYWQVRQRIGPELDAIKAEETVFGYEGP